MDQKRRLKGMLARIFSDATAEADERTELSTFLASGALTKEEVKEVVADFVGTTWKITMADGVISDMERARLNEIVVVLGLARSELPEDWVLALRGSVAPTP